LRAERQGGGGVGAERGGRRAGERGRRWRRGAVRTAVQSAAGLRRQNVHRALEINDYGRRHSERVFQCGSAAPHQQPPLSHRLLDRAADAADVAAGHQHWRHVQRRLPAMAHHRHALRPPLLHDVQDPGQGHCHVEEGVARQFGALPNIIRVIPYLPPPNHTWYAPHAPLPARPTPRTLSFAQPTNFFSPPHLHEASFLPHASHSPFPSSPTLALLPSGYRGPHTTAAAAGGGRSEQQYRSNRHSRGDASPFSTLPNGHSHSSTLYNPPHSHHHHHHHEAASLKPTMSLDSAFATRSFAAAPPPSALLSHASLHSYTSLDSETALTVHDLVDPTSLPAPVEEEEGRGVHAVGEKGREGQHGGDSCGEGREGDVPGGGGGADAAADAVEDGRAGAGCAGAGGDGIIDGGGGAAAAAAASGVAAGGGEDDELRKPLLGRLRVNEDGERQAATPRSQVRSHATFSPLASSCNPSPLLPVLSFSPLVFTPSPVHPPSRSPSFSCLLPTIYTRLTASLPPCLSRSAKRKHRQQQQRGAGGGG
ncbi:unnamed protein product, partial [Closterium sp. Naga37s-1]